MWCSPAVKFHISDRGELTQIVWHVLQMGLDDGWVNVLVVPQKMEILGVVLKVCL